MQQVASEASQTTLNFLIQSLLPSILVLIGFIFASRQVREAARSYRATVLLQLTNEWNDPKIYDAINYIHKLRREWKERVPEFSKWLPLAQEWLNEHNPNSQQTTSPEKQRLMDEWNKRRLVSQFLSKMGYMMSEGYIKPKDFFAFVPEADRLLMVLEPIDICIVKYYQELEKPSEGSEGSDRPFGKIGFRFIKDKYSEWFATDGRDHLSRQDNF